MSKDWEEKAIIQDLRQAQRHSEQIARFCNTPASRRRALKLSEITQDRIIGKIERMGYTVHKTTHNAPFDAWVAGCKIEFKASKWPVGAATYLITNGIVPTRNRHNSNVRRIHRLWRQ